MGFLSLIQDNPLAGIILAILLFLSIGVHEAAHAYSAYWLGDSTPKQQGRLTLNPLRHLDPIGSLFIFLVGIGWGRPVEFNPYNLKNARFDSALIAFAGPLSNILMAILSSVIIYLINIFIPNLPFVDFLSLALAIFIQINLGLAIFNLIPLDPLDGFKVVAGILPSFWVLKWYETRKYGYIVLLVLFITGSIGTILGPIVGSLYSLIMFINVPK